MARLVDIIAPAPIVKIRGAAFEVAPLSLEVMVGLIARFKHMAGMLKGETDMLELISGAGEEAICAVVAAALRETEDDVRKVRLNAAEQFEIIIACLEITLPEDPTEAGKLIARAAGLVERAGLA